MPPLSLHRAGAEAPPINVGLPPPGPLALSFPHPLRRYGIHPLPVIGRAAQCAPLGAVGASSPHPEPPSRAFRHPQTSSSQPFGAPPVPPARCSPPGAHPPPFPCPIARPLEGESPPALAWGSSLPSGKTPVLMDLLPASPSHSGTTAHSGASGVWPSCCLHSGSLTGCAVTRVTAWGERSRYFPA